MTDIIVIGGGAAGMMAAAKVDERNREVARKMKVENITAEVIAKCTGLTIEEVEAL